MRYLDVVEYRQWGVSGETSDDRVSSASAMIDAFCRRTSLGVTRYVERVRFARGSHTVHLSYLPLAVENDGLSPLISVRVRMGRHRRDVVLDPLQAEAASLFGLSGAWGTIAPSTINVGTGDELEFMPHLFGLPYDEVEVTYTAGWNVIPDAVKAACSQIVRNMVAVPALNVKRTRVASVQMEYFQDSLLSEEVRLLLRPYIATRLGRA